jgi:hypothetical protein
MICGRVLLQLSDLREFALHELRVNRPDRVFEIATMSKTRL